MKTKPTKSMSKSMIGTRASANVDDEDATLGLRRFSRGTIPAN